MHTHTRANYTGQLSSFLFNILRVTWKQPSAWEDIFKCDIPTCTKDGWKNTVCQRLQNVLTGFLQFVLKWLCSHKPKGLFSFSFSRSLQYSLHVCMSVILSIDICKPFLTASHFPAHLYSGQRITFCSLSSLSLPEQGVSLQHHKSEDQQTDNLIKQKSKHHIFG